MHDGDEVSEVGFGKALELDVEDATIDTFYAWNFLSPFKE